MTTELPEDPFAASPALDLLSSALTAAPADDELVGEAAALAMYRAVRQPGRGPAAREHRRTRTLVAAAALALAGCMAAAYAAVLPAQVQHAAYQVLGFIGVPDAPHRPPSHPRPAAGAPVTSPSPPASRHPGGSRSPGTSPRSAPASPSASPRRSPPAAALAATGLTIAAARQRIAAGSRDELYAELTGRGRPVAGQVVQLLQRDAGTAHWQPAGQMLTNLAGGATLSPSAITVNTWFRLTGPDQTRSSPVLVIVVPQVSLGLTAGPAPHTVVLTVGCQYAAPGDFVLLQVRADGFWESVRSHRLGPGSATTFTVRVPATGRRVLRAVLLATVSHGRSASEPIILRRS